MQKHIELIVILGNRIVLEWFRTNIIMLLKVQPNGQLLWLQVVLKRSCGPKND